MSSLYPIYTVQAECHDCYKCVRQCPVKAIRIENGIASVIAERCIACGRCVKVCPSHAKRVRNDLQRFRNDLAGSVPVYVSLAPSWSGVFSDWSKGSLIAALKKIGVQEVSETALGAQEVSAALAHDLSKKVQGIYFSSACPAVVDYIRMYHPQEVGRITPIASPVLTHCALLRKKYGDKIKVVFIGPCAAKKNESDRHSEWLNLALTFDELRMLFAEEGITSADFVDSSEAFVPELAAEGTLYPLEGGMLETIRRSGCDERVQLQAMSGILLLGESLEHLHETRINQPVFVEALACPGGCVNGPCAKRISGLSATSGVLEQATVRSPELRLPSVRVPLDYLPVYQEKSESFIDEETLRKALQSVGKTTPEDELNCGGCGYDSCREFAKALVQQNAEPAQCVSWMRRIAMRKANALLRCMPAGVAILDSNLQIVESNEAFSRLFGDELVDLYQNVPGLEGADILSILPCETLFQAALQYGKDIHKEHYPVGDQLLDLTLFTIDPGKVIGVIVQDVTEMEMRRDQIAQRAEEVIARNITVVQEIACRLGEHMADTEILLNSITEGYRSKKQEPKPL